MEIAWKTTINCNNLRSLFEILKVTEQCICVVVLRRTKYVECEILCLEVRMTSLRPSLHRSESNIQVRPVLH